MNDYQARSVLSTTDDWATLTPDARQELIDAHLSGIQQMIPPGTDWANMTHMVTEEKSRGIVVLDVKA